MINFDWESFRNGYTNVLCKNNSQVEDFFEKAKINGFKRYKRDINIENEVSEFYKYSNFNGLTYYTIGKNKIIADKTNHKNINSAFHWKTDEEELEDNQKETQKITPFDFKIEDIVDKKILVQCKTKNNARALFRRWKKNGITWADGLPLSETFLRWEHNSETVYGLSTRSNGKIVVKYGKASGMKRDGWVIYEMKEEQQYV